jgi:hypothetical protein
LLGVEHLEAHQEMKILHRQTRDGKEKVGLELRDDILQRVLAEIRQVHEGWDAGCKFYELLLHQLSLRLEFSLLFREFLLLLRSESALFRFALWLLDTFAFVDDGLDDVISERPPPFDPLNCGHCIRVLKHSSQGVVVDIHQHRALPLAREQCRGGAGHGNIQDAAGVDLCVMFAPS